MTARPTPHKFKLDQWNTDNCAMCQRETLHPNHLGYRPTLEEMASEAHGCLGRCCEVAPIEAFCRCQHHKTVSIAHRWAASVLEELDDTEPGGNARASFAMLEYKFNLLLAREREAGGEK